VAVVLIYSAWAVTLASAHALLVRSNPAANAVLEQSPAQLTRRSWRNWPSLAVTPAGRDHAG